LPSDPLHLYGASRRRKRQRASQRARARTQVSLALFGAFVETVGLDEVNLLHPLEFGGLILGAMLPYWFSALTMRSVGKAALAMVAEVRRQFRDIRGLAEGHARPDYSECVRISTTAAIKVASRRLARPAPPRPACSRGRHFSRARRKCSRRAPSSSSRPW
jgi:hypothetical protein